MGAIAVFVSLLALLLHVRDAGQLELWHAGNADICEQEPRLAAGQGDAVGGACSPRPSLIR